MAGKKLDLAAITFRAYPKAVDCTKGHIGKPVLVFHTEYDDDRSYLMVLKRCDHCGMPVGGDDYANAENEERNRIGLPPVPQEQD